MLSWLPNGVFKLCLLYIVGILLPFIIFCISLNSWTPILSRSYGTAKLCCLNCLSFSQYLVCPFTLAPLAFDNYPFYFEHFFTSWPRHYRFILYFPHPFLKPAILPKSPGSCNGMVFRNQDLLLECHCFRPS